MNALKLLNKQEVELKWLSREYDDLKEKFDNEFIAIEDRNVIAHNKDFMVVIKDLKAKHKDPSQVLIEFISKVPLIL